MSTPIVQLLSKTVNAFFNNSEVQREVCKIARRCTKPSSISSGNTTSRPADAQVGQVYFDTDLSQPLWYNGADWVDATGTAV